MAGDRLNLFSFSGNIRILHLTWVAFFISFAVWFSHAPLMPFIREAMGLTDQQIKALLILNVAFTIPARIVVGMLVDKFGPRILFSSILLLSGVLCLFFAFAETYQQLAVTRFLLGFVGAGFVVGIRMISEWFPAKQTGMAQGIYGGWGNFGSAAAALLLPSLALFWGGDDGWRYAITITGLISITYAVIYYLTVSDTPKGSTYFKPKKMGGMEVTSKADLILYLAMGIPMFAALGVLTWKLSPQGLNWFSNGSTYAIYAALTGIYFYQAYKIIDVNRGIFKAESADMFRYSFKQVAILDLAYMVTFGSELALVSMLPLFYVDMFGISPIVAGLLAAIYPMMNLIARPAGGVISDKYGRKLTLVALFSGISLTFIFLGQVTSDWAVWLVVATTIICGVFAKAGSGAVFAMVPLIQRRFTGQIAGMVGAYGNVGGVIFLTVLSFVTAPTFFLCIGLVATFVLATIVIFLNEPKGSMAEVLPDGTVELIDVS